MRKLFLILFTALLSLPAWSQSIHEYNYDVNNGGLPVQYDVPGSIVYPTGYAAYNTYTPVIFVHGITGKLSGSYEANIQSVKARHLKAAFVQLDPIGTPEENGKLLKRMIDRITSHFGAATVSIVAHSKGGMDTERALYGQNPYQSGIPSFGYEKVDAVYTFGSPLKGSRVADVGASLSWTGIAWIAMWYLNGYQLTSASVQEFHNWAQSWNITSNGTFRNYYHPNGASYTRRNMIEDNTTRWWAHQSDDPCYENKWYFCYVGNAFHHSAGAYYDAYWEWDWWNSGWRNWHTENDGFIAVYRAQREVIQSASPALTPGAGDFNYITMHDANHTSLWDPGQGHFDREVASYLHRGLYAYQRPTGNTAPGAKSGNTPPAGVTAHPVYLSNGYITASLSGEARLIVENDGDNYLFTVWSEQPVHNLSLSQGIIKKVIPAYKSEYNERLHAYENAFRASNMPRGQWRVFTGHSPAVFMSYNETPRAGFAVKWNWDEALGYQGRPVEVKVRARDMDYRNVQVAVMITRLAGGDHGKLEKVIIRNGNEKGDFSIDLAGLLQPGQKYAVRVVATAKHGEHLLQRSAITTVYVPRDIPVRNITAAAAKGLEEKSELGFEPSVFPNPARDHIELVSDKAGFNAWILNTSGQNLGHIRAQGYRAQWSLEHLPAGVYMIRIETNAGTLTRRLIKK